MHTCGRILVLFTWLSFSSDSCILVRARVGTRDTMRAHLHTYSTSQIQRTERDRCFTNNSGTRLWKCTSNNDRDAKRTFSYRVKLPRTTRTAKTSRQINFTIFHQQRKLADNSFALTRAHAAHRTARSCFLEFNWRFIIKICVHATGHIYSRSHACRVRVSIFARPAEPNIYNPWKINIG